MKKYIAEREDGKTVIINEQEMENAEHDSGSEYRSWDEYHGEAPIGTEAGQMGYLRTVEVALLFGVSDRVVRANVSRGALRGEMFGKTLLIAAPTALAFYSNKRRFRR